MKDTDNLLIGSVWKRVQGKHGEATGIVDALNERGPRLKLSDGSHRRLSWAELDFGWLTADSSSQKKYDLWKLAAKVEYLDTIIEGEPRVNVEVTNGNTPIMTTPEVSVKECHGAWHRHDLGKGKGIRYDLLPLTAFSVNKAGKNKGQLSATCDECKEKNNKSPSHQPKKVTAPEPLPLKLKVEPVIDTPEGAVYRWRVIVVQPQEHFVHAKDFLDAAAQVAALGEVTKVEKL